MSLITQKFDYRKLQRVEVDGKRRYDWGEGVPVPSVTTILSATKDNTHLIDTFWRKTNELDSIRNEQLLSVIPELRALL